jgi:phage baseplate assembly protein W
MILHMSDTDLLNKASARQNSVNKDFLGTGWSFPPTFTRHNHTVQMVSNDADIQESLWILFSTALGERMMVPQYGTGLAKMVFRTISTTLTSQMKNMVKQAILNWEPRIDVDEVQVQPDATQFGKVLINVIYTIRMTNTRSNLVYPFYLTEGTIPAKTP